eukprot:TRINITY_DN4162_c0_g1_i16.p1 TRINITY_DN4162_c0_g1~~TRINITY_DN4162_c0_g1_i16.p1  ORF type:complete len:211 (+),score=90.47 TRINITY_DN4162_c0_g1_i16:110-742(+)
MDNNNNLGIQLYKLICGARKREQIEQIEFIKQLSDQEILEGNFINQIKINVLKTETEKQLEYLKLNQLTPKEITLQQLIEKYKLNEQQKEEFNNPNSKFEFVKQRIELINSRKFEQLEQLDKNIIETIHFYCFHLINFDEKQKIIDDYCNEQFIITLEDFKQLNVKNEDWKYNNLCLGILRTMIETKKDKNVFTLIDKIKVTIDNEKNST